MRFLDWLDRNAVNIMLAFANICLILVLAIIAWVNYG
jgi:hypothetical protein